MWRISWVLCGELAVGPAPRHASHGARLLEEGITGVLSLCSEAEAPPPALPLRLQQRRLVLPDHRAGRPPRLQELERALVLLAELRQQGPVYVHCKAGVERSPLVCLAWLMQRRSLRQLEALDYLMQVHPPTGVLPQQLEVLAQLPLAPLQPGHAHVA